MSALYFLGRFHVLLLHLPIALLLVVLMVEALARPPRHAHLRAALPLLWGASAVTAVLTVVLGYMHFSEGGFTGPSATAHRFFGTTVAVVATLAWLVRSLHEQLFLRIGLATSAVLVVLVSITGHFGGNLTHGDTYLVEYAPSFVRRLAGLPEARAPVTDLAAADPYLDIVKPIFSQRCGSCHNDDKTRGGLNLARYDALMKGGKDGPVVVPGKPQDSDLVRRITLPQDHKDFMPAEGKTPLTARQVGLVTWWIGAGAPTGTTVGRMTVSADVRESLVAQLGLGVEPVPRAASATAQGQTKVDRKMLAGLEHAGLMARQVTLDSTDLVVSPLAPGSSLRAEQLGVLEPIAQQILELNLGGAGLTDDDVAAIAKLSRVTALHLENNAVGDAGVKQLAGLGQVEYLNLYGNENITDASVALLAGMSALRRVFLWRTGVTSAGAERLRKSHPGIEVDMGE